MLTSDPKKVRGQHYDIVVNGVELGGGSIRIHQPEVQKTIFEQVLQIPPDMVKARFGYMLEAFRYGAPPHGGIALGFDRLIAILCGTPSIRDVIAFPKTAKGTDLMTDSPAAVEPKQLRDLHLELKVAKKEPPAGNDRAVRNKRPHPVHAAGGGVDSAGNHRALAVEGGRSLYLRAGPSHRGERRLGDSGTGRRAVHAKAAGDVCHCGDLRQNIWWAARDGHRLSAVRWSSFNTLTLMFVGIGARELVGPGKGWYAPALFMGCLGFVQLSHMLICDVSLVTGFAIAFAGLAMSGRRGFWAEFCLAPARASLSCPRD